MSYNLNELAGQDYFQLMVDGNAYKMAYPSANDLLELEKMDTESTKLSVRLQDIATALLSEKDEKSRRTLVSEAEKIKGTLESETDSMLEWCMKYITPETSDLPDFRELIMSKSVKYLMAFMDIVKKEIR